MPTNEVHSSHTQRECSRAPSRTRLLPFRISEKKFLHKNVTAERAVSLKYSSRTGLHSPEEIMRVTRSTGIAPVTGTPRGRDAPLRRNRRTWRSGGAALDCRFTFSDGKLRRILRAKTLIGIYKKGAWAPSPHPISAFDAACTPGATRKNGPPLSIAARSAAG